MTYEPFNRGEYPVGVRTIETSKEPRSGRKTIIEVWYPATEEYRGKDRNAATTDRFNTAPGLPEQTQEAVRDAEMASVGRVPLIMYFHGADGYRRELAHVAAHLASRGYVVAAPDFLGDNIADLRLGEKNDETANQPVDKSATDRPHQASFLISSLLENSQFAPFIDSNKIGAFSQSMGGFTALRLNSLDARPKASVAIAPLYGKNDFVPQIARIQIQLRVDDWNRAVPTLLLAGERDSFVLLEGLRRLARELRAPKRLVILRNAGHFHWTANAEQGHEIFRQSYLSGNIADREVDGKGMAEAMRPFAELAPAWHAADTVRALCLAHFDENLKGSREARIFLDNNAAETFAARGIDLEFARIDKKETAGV
ncbi:MAG TPA: dienelactone hydrolase family protein [Pyrinomonadaceae bacterium]|jgi:predicted dienelactone hydrolase